MNRCSLQQNAFVSRDEMRGGFVPISDPKDPVVCPMPRRVGILANNVIRPLRLHMSQASEVCDSKAGADLLDIILRKEDYGTGQSLLSVASSPPFFCGSPPSRASNPQVQDARFGDEKLNPISPSPLSAGFPSPTSVVAPRGKGGCVRMKFGLKPAAVRVEGFDCLDRDRQNSSIPAMA
ncbi:PREDICTED: uncharacterized protein LOC104820949 [Tarenaya hassleriana]|nr:PREDICTED: uncharacterized protein LOC104820949 [Tarenaya hassleriana]XP_010549927.1 PREDICTED: uncharacterized protein LOC104820949 [Tarenaya hassleriana]